MAWIWFIWSRSIVRQQSDMYIDALDFKNNTAVVNIGRNGNSYQRCSCFQQLACGRQS